MHVCSQYWDRMRPTFSTLQGELRGRVGGGGGGVGGVAPPADLLAVSPWCSRKPTTPSVPPTALSEMSTARPTVLPTILPARSPNSTPTPPRPRPACARAGARGEALRAAGQAAARQGDARQGAQEEDDGRRRQAAPVQVQAGAVAVTRFRSSAYALLTTLVRMP